MAEQNGTYCGAGSLEEKLDGIMSVMGELIEVMDEIKQDHAHLRRISSSNEMICSTLVEIKTSLINAVLGKDIVPVGVAKSMIEEQRKAYITIIRTLCWVFGVIVCVLAGLKVLAPQWFH